jgi:hypothetical protein
LKCCVNGRVKRREILLSPVTDIFAVNQHIKRLSFFGDASPHNIEHTHTHHHKRECTRES